MRRVAMGGGIGEGGPGPQNFAEKWIQIAQACMTRRWVRETL